MVPLNQKNRILMFDQFKGMLSLPLVLTSSAIDVVINVICLDGDLLPTYDIC
jgi:hypothetical protein